MPDFMRVRIITRDVSEFPHRDLATIPLSTSLEVWWGERDVLPGYVTVMDLGEQRLDFGGGLDLTPRTADNYDTSLDSTLSSPVARPTSPRRSGRRAARKKTTRRKAKAKTSARRSGGRAKKT